MTTHKPRRLSLSGTALLLLLPVQAAQAADPHSAAGLAQRVNQLQAQVDALQAQLATLIAISPYVTLLTVNGKPTLRFSGANVQVVNGQGNTASVNGLGNLIVGYDEADTSGFYHCTLGTNPETHEPIVSDTDCIVASGSWVNTGFKTGSHYLVLGSGNNYSRWGGVIAGVYNTSNYDFASASGGYHNIAGGPYSNASGGFHNTAGGEFSTASGGYHNNASGRGSTASGGASNTTSGEYSSASGGGGNTASGGASSVSGGSGNTASGGASSVSGGLSNTASGFYSSVLGGDSQNATASTQTIPALP